MTDSRKYDLILKQTTDGAYLVQPCRGVGYRPEFWLQKRRATLADTRRERFGTAQCRVGVFEIATDYAVAKGLTEQDHSKEASVHAITK